METRSIAVHIDKPPFAFHKQKMNQRSMIWGRKFKVLMPKSAENIVMEIVKQELINKRLINGW
jgi:hypothetical protein